MNTITSNYHSHVTKETSLNTFHSGLLDPGNHEYSQNDPTAAIQNTNNYLIPDGSNRCIHDLQDKILHIGILDNGHNAYLVELPDLKSLLHTSRYLMDEVTGQFYVIYGNSYVFMEIETYVYYP